MESAQPCADVPKAVWVLVVSKLCSDLNAKDNLNRQVGHAAQPYWRGLSKMDAPCHPHLRGAFG